jgi:hypothetical protein
MNGAMGENLCRSNGSSNRTSTIVKQRGLKEMMEEANAKGVAFGAPVSLAGPESELLGNAYFLDSSQPLRHFIKFKHFVELFQKRALRLARLDSFKDDPKEGLLSESNAGAPSDLGRQLTQQWGTNPETDGWKRFINGTLRTLTYVHCWFGQESEDRDMWQTYGDGGRGVCLKTTVHRFEEALKLGPPLFPQLHKVSYLSEEVAIPTVISSLASFRKRPEFAHEKEFRLVGQLGFEDCPKDSSGALLPTQDHQIVPVDLERLLEAVVIGPNTDDSQFSQLETLLGTAGLSRLARKAKIPPWNR